MRANFSDVPAEYPYYKAINYVQAEGIVEGYSDGTFRPDGNINRAEFTKILVEAAVGTPETSVSQNCFKDVKDEWFYVYVCFAKGKGWIGGYSDGSFKPDQPINFAEAAKIIVNTLVAKTASGDPWYKPYVDFLYEKYVIPKSVSAFDHKLTRGEMAEMIYRLKAQVKEQSKSYDELDQANWKTYASPSVQFVIKYPADYAVKADTAETVKMDRLLTSVTFSKDNTCPLNYESYCIEKSFSVRVFNNQGSQSPVQFIDTNERYHNWEVRSEDLKVDTQPAWLLYPSETELYAVRYVFGDGYMSSPMVYPYFFEVEISSGIDQDMQNQILESLRYYYEGFSASSMINITAPEYGASVKTTPFYVYGVTSADCSRILVHASNPARGMDDTYQLQNYKYGDTTFKYGVSPLWSNLAVGNNMYEFVAYCDANNISASLKLEYAGEYY